MNYFTIFGSKTLTLGSNYKLAVNGFGEKKHKIDFSLKVDERSVDSKVIEIGGHECQFVEFNMKDEPQNDYQLCVKCVDSSDEKDVKTFVKEISLNMNTTKAAIIIQTDKSSYKPSDIVQFRIIAFDALTKPFVGKSSEILVYDAQQNIVKKIANPEWMNGVYQNEFQLSDQPIFGNWNVEVTIDQDLKQNKSFEVAEYVLPTLEVVIDAEKDIWIGNDKLTAEISAKYTHGKLAKGKATITLSEKSNHYGGCFGFRRPMPEPNFKMITKIVDIDGKTSVDFDMSGLKNNADVYYQPSLTLKVDFIEDLTEREYSKSQDITVHTKENHVEFDDFSTFCPGLPFAISAKILSFNRDPVVAADQKSKVKVVLQRSWTDQKPTWTGKSGKIRNNAEEEFEDEIEVKNGRVEFKFTPVPENTQWIRFEVKYKDAEGSSHYSKAESVSDQYLRMSTQLNDNNELSVNILTTENIKSLTYQVIGLNEVFVSQNLNFAETKEKSFKVEIPEKFSLAEIKVFVFYIRSDGGEVVFDSKTIQCNGSLKNSMNLSLANDVAKPSENLTINIESKEKSVVGLLAVDKSVLLMKKGNDFTKEDIKSRLQDFTHVNHYNSNYNYESTIVDDLDAFILTNAKTRTDEDHYRPRPCGKMMMRGSAPAGFSNEMVLNDDMGEQSESAQTTGLFGGGGQARMAPNMMQSTVNVAEIKVRKDFPETWFFDLVKSEDGIIKMTKKIPDTITSWIISGFSMSSIHGLGIIDHPKELKVFQPFFVSTNLPYSIKRGEIVSIQFLVSNYLEKSQTVQLTFFNDDNDFEFQEDNAAKEVTKIVEIKANEVASEKFVIKPLKVGKMKIKVRAVSEVAGDIVEKFLLVKPEGICHYKNEGFIVNLKEKNEFTKSMKIEMPNEIVPGSKRVEISIIGDIMGPALDNLNNLIRIPYGCGEQNMLNFVPNIIVLDYLKVMNKVTPAIYAKAKSYMEKGYQSELTYKHHDGSYSAFGMGDKSGCTWLTAFVAKSFVQARKYIEIDDKIIKTAYKFLCHVQKNDGSFPEVGSLFHKEMQGGASSGVGLTSYVVAAIMENPNYKEDAVFENAVQRGLKFIAENLEKVKDNYALSIVTYTFQKANHPMKDSLLDKLDKASCSGSGDVKYWTADGEEQSTKDRPRSLNIEMTSYALQAYIEAKREVDAFYIMKWLISQRNSKGGFYSTQDTIVGLEALSKAAVIVGDSNKNVDVMVKYDGKDSKFSVNNDNAMVLQSHLLSADTENVEVHAIGQGICIVQLAHQYNVSDVEKNAFNLQTEVGKLEGSKLVVKVNVSFGSSDKSNMVVLEIELPSGFVYDKEFENKLKENRLVKKIETKEGDTSVAIYFDEMGNEKNTLEIHANKMHEVTNLKPADVKVYDYYDNARHTSTFYKVNM